MNKVVKDGKVAVLVSPGFGAGWSTWNPECIGMLFDPEIVEFILRDDYEFAKRFDEIEALCAKKYPNAYCGGARDLMVAWVPEGAEFVVREYDGNEYLEMKDDIKWVIA
jgi:hypothetical protein